MPTYLRLHFAKPVVYLVVTASKIGSDFTEADLSLSVTRDFARSIKAQLEVGNVEFVTVPNPYFL